MVGCPFEASQVNSEATNGPVKRQLIKSEPSALDAEAYLISTERTRVLLLLEAQGELGLRSALPVTWRSCSWKRNPKI
jgi:hypothetical protein